MDVVLGPAEEVAMADVMELAGAERADLAELLATLTPQQWQTPSLCAGWRVREVVAHVLSYEELDAVGVLRRFARGRFLLGRTNAAGVSAAAERSPQQLLDVLHRSLRPRGLTVAFGGRIGLLDAMIHHQDIRRPLGLARDIPAERLRVALDFARMAPPVGTPWRIRGLRLIATDLDWATGRGKEVRGPAESLLMAMAGRRGISDELSGAGQPILAGRTGD